MKISCRELKRIARENLTHHYSTPMGALLVAGIIPLAIELPFSMIMGAHPSLLQNITFYAAEFLIALLGCVLNAGVIFLHLNMARKKQYSIRMVFYGFQNDPNRFLGAGLIELVLVLLCLIPFFAGIHCLKVMNSPAAYATFFGLSCISLILCALIALNLNLMIYFVIDQPDMPLLQCLKCSVRSMHGYKGNLLYIYLSFVGLQILNIFSVGVGSLWIGPYRSQTMANFYRTVIGERSPAQETPHSGYTPSFNRYV